MNKNLAFTLIELLVVIAIIGILSGLIVVSMSGVTTKATIAKAQVFSNSLRNSLMLDLISEYKMDGNANDSWGSNPGTIVGAPTVSTDCVYGSCYSFNGTSDAIGLGTSSTLEPTAAITLAAWAKFGGGSYSHIITNPSSDVTHNWYDYDISLSAATAYFKLRTANLTGAETISKAVGSSGWHYVVGTYNGSNMTLYVDGVAGTPYAKTGAIQYLAYAQITVGAWTTTQEYFKGLIDEIRIYDAAVSGSQIREQYFAGLNSLLSRGEMTKEEYSLRLNKLNDSLAVN